MNLRRNQIIYTPHGFGYVKSVRSYNQTLDLLNSNNSTRKKSKQYHLNSKEGAANNMNTCSQTELNADKKNKSILDPFEFDFNFGEIFILFEQMAKIDQCKLQVDENGLVEVSSLDGSSGFISPK